MSELRRKDLRSGGDAENRILFSRVFLTAAEQEVCIIPSFPVITRLGEAMQWGAAAKRRSVPTVFISTLNANQKCLPPGIPGHPHFSRFCGRERWFRVQWTAKQNADYVNDYRMREPETGDYTKV
jgi:hypothetical protein